MEQALMEVEYEEELRSLQAEVANYEKQMDNEAKWMHEQEEHIKQNQERIRNQLESVLAVKKSERDVKTKVAGLQMMRQILPTLVKSMEDDNIKTGKWIIPERVNVETKLLPEVMNDVNKCVSTREKCCELVDSKCHQ